MNKTKKQGVSNHAQGLSEYAWYYERQGGIDIVVWVGTGDARRSTIVKIPAAMLRASIARMNVTRARRSRARR